MEIQKHLDEIHNKGYTVLERVITPRECERFKTYLEEDYQKYAPLHFKSGKKTAHGLEDKSSEKVVINLHNKRLEYFDLLGHSAVLSILDILLKEGSYLNSEPYYLYNNSARSPLKGSEQQLHLDSRFPGTRYVFVANVLWMLDDFTEESGATRIVPGSHKSGQYAADGKKYDNEILVLAPKGSVLIFDASLWHGSSYKYNDSARWALALGYARWFRKPTYDYMQNTPIEIFDNLTDGQKELLGFRFVPPKDEFTRTRSISENFEIPQAYHLP